MLMPLHLSSGIAAQEAVAEGTARRLVDGPVAFSGCRVFARHADRIEIWDLAPDALAAFLSNLEEPHRTHLAAQAERLAAKRPPWAGLDMGHPQIMGILNVTPDSFSDGGAHDDAGRALAAARTLADQGAAILDIGGESTRPGAEPADEAQELDRVRPVWEGLAGQSTVELSADTRRASVMRLALANGATIVNDVSALQDDPEAMAVVSENTAHVVLVHRRGASKTMNVAPSYAHAPLDVYEALEARIAACERAGIPRTRIAVDPGIGFGKRGPHNREIMRALALFHGLGCPIVLGLSRKSFSHAMEETYAPGERLPGTLAALTLALEAGVQILRVHDVAAVRQAVETWRTITATRDDD